MTRFLIPETTIDEMNGNFVIVYILDIIQNLLKTLFIFFYISIIFINF